MRFDETTLENADGRLRLLDRSGNVHLELNGHEIDDAIRDGYVDPSDLHRSLYEYARMIRETGDAFMKNHGLE